jgi:acyl-CoA synthetase (AMP-forming)/AMP-acid ligase II
MDFAWLDHAVLLVGLPAIGIVAVWLYLRSRQAQVRTIAAHELLDALDRLEALARRSKNRAQQIGDLSAEVEAAGDQRRALYDQTTRLFAQVMGQALKDRQWIAEYALAATTAELDARRTKLEESIAQLERYLETLDVGLSKAQAVSRG